jgi:hypothetical protein
MRVRLLLPAILLASCVAFAEVPPEVWKTIADAAEGLGNDDSTAFFNQFDRNMPAYAALRTNVEALLNGNQVISTLVTITDDGDDRKRSLELDWLMALNDKNDPDVRKETRRGIVKVRVELQGKRWKIVALEPVDFFRP